MVSKDRKGNCQKNFDEGKAGEYAIARAFREMKWIVASNTTINDELGGFDLSVLRSIEGDTQHRDAEYMHIQVKATRHPPTIEKCLDSHYNGLMVEWRSGSDNLATSFCDESSPVTHYAYLMRGGARMSLNERIPFMLVSIHDMRQFYFAHKDDKNIVRPWKGKDEVEKSYNLDMKLFIEEYGLEYYHFDKEANMWRSEIYGNGIHPLPYYSIENGPWASIVDMTGGGSFGLSEKVFEKKRKVADEFVLKYGFGGNEGAIEKFIKGRQKYDTRYAPDNMNTESV